MVRDVNLIKFVVLTFGLLDMTTSMEYQFLEIWVDSYYLSTCQQTGSVIMIIFAVIVLMCICQQFVIEGHNNSQCLP